MTWPPPPLPHRAAALERLASVQPGAYARTRNHIQGAVTGLSPYLTHGLVTLPEVLREVLQHETLAVSHKFVFELGWREFFRHVYSHVGEGIFESLHEGPLPDEAYVSTVPADVRQGCTGVPVIDQAVRALYATGSLHNHARMWLASYLVHLRRVHWRAGADWMVAHLLDGDLASNHLSWQWVAGTGSSKPYLFNADNVARYAPAHWHSPGSVVDQSYEALDHMARARSREGLPDHYQPAALAVDEPRLYSVPPAAMGLGAPDASTQREIQGRPVWLVHPWALRSPPPGLPTHTVVVGIYLSEYHAQRPWPEARWRWVDSAMAEVTSLRWFLGAQTLAALLAPAASVRGVDDLHITRWLPPLARLEPAPRLFASVQERCHSFSQWWTRVTRGLKNAEQLL